VDPRYPFLLCHGLLGFDTLKVVPSLIEVDYWRGGIAQTLRRRRRPEEGAQGGVFISRVPSTGHVHERALCIKKQVAQILDPPLASKVPGTTTAVPQPLNHSA
jgi:triacylglycerol lipase